jgi:hypothetical protein
MRPLRARRRQLKEIAPVLRSTWDGRPLLPQEIPIIGAEPAPAADTDPLVAALAMFDDMLSRPAPRVATPIESFDRWGMIQKGDSGPQLMDAVVDEVLHGEPTMAEGAPAMKVTHEGWGDSGDLIEEWFQTGEFLAAEPIDLDRRITWFGSLVRRVRRAWLAPRTPDATALESA